MSCHVAIIIHPPILAKRYWSHMGGELRPWGAVNGNNSGDDADGACHDGGDLLVTMHQNDGRPMARSSLGAAVAELQTRSVEVAVG